MDESEIRLKITEVLSKILNLSEKEIREKIEKGDLIFWNSITHLNLMFPLEHEFGLSFIEKDLMGMEDFDKILNRIKKRPIEQISRLRIRP